MEEGDDNSSNKVKTIKDINQLIHSNSDSFPMKHQLDKNKIPLPSKGKSLGKSSSVGANLEKIKELSSINKKSNSSSDKSFMFPVTGSESSFDLFRCPSPSDGPLLGSDQLERYICDRKAIIQVTTWNMGTLPLPKEHHLKKLFCFVGEDLLRKIDVQVIAIQESWPEIESWEIELQVCLGPGFVLYHSISFGTLHLSVFLRRDLIWFTSEPQETTLKVRSARLFKTKGCAGISFNLFGSKLLFVNSHLSAGRVRNAVNCRQIMPAGEEQDRCNQRLEELGKIIQVMQKANQTYDALFLSGDLNFRLNNIKRDVILDSLMRGNLEGIVNSDQLNLTMSRDKDSKPGFLQGFIEAGPISFKPTYKYDIGSDCFDSSNKRRVPAYTDRIIYKSKINPNGESIVKNLAYDAIMNMRLSDHRPVYAIFSVDIKPGFDSLPISGGRFKRDIFIKGIQKRAKYLLERRKKLASTVCVLS